MKLSSSGRSHKAPVVVPSFRTRFVVILDKQTRRPLLYYKDMLTPDTTPPEEVIPYFDRKLKDEYMWMCPECGWWIRFEPLTYDAEPCEHWKHFIQLCEQSRHRYNA